MSETVVRTDAEAERRLRELGLHINYVDEAVRVGVEARWPKNDFEPRSASGLKDWIARVGELRKQTVHNAGWKYANPSNIPLIYYPGKYRALGVLLGDRNTGSRDPQPGPRSKYPKGASVSDATAPPGDQPFDMDLAQSGGWGLLTAEDLRKMDVWFLVTHPAWDGERFVVYREVSRPTFAPPDSKITEWRERLIVEPQSFPSPSIQSEQPLVSEQPEDIDVYVEAR